MEGPAPSLFHCCPPILFLTHLNPHQPAGPHQTHWSHVSFGLAQTGQASFANEAMKFSTEASHHHVSKQSNLGSSHQGLRSIHQALASAKVSRSLQRPFSHQRRIHAFFCSAIQSKLLRGQLDAWPVAAKYQILTWRSILRASHWIPASEEGECWGAALLSIPWPQLLPHLQKVAECNYAESSSGAISIRQTSVVSFSLSKAFLLPNCSYRIIA